MYEVIGFQIILLAEQGCCVDGHRANSPKASRCSRENIKKKKIYQTSCGFTQHFKFKYLFCA